MKSFTMDKSQFGALFSELGSAYTICGPRRFAGKGRFSNTDLIKYAPLGSPEELELAEKSSLSPKSLVFPPDETIFHFNENEFSEPNLNCNRDIIVLLRACDINGFSRLDRMFLENGGKPDFYYQRRRRRLIFFLIECRESFENCFCVSMQTNITDNFAVALRFDAQQVLAQVKDERFRAFFAGHGQAGSFSPEFVTRNQKHVELPKVDNMPAEMFTHKLWEEYDSRCIACGRCNTSCITCSCFSTIDLFYADSRQCGERRRVWDGCHLDGFTDMAGGHSFRKNKGERMRFKTFHKVYDYRRRFGVEMCVGCGRCDDVCPEYISFSHCINKLTQAVKGGDRNDR